MTGRFSKKPKMKAKQNAQFRIQIILLSNPKIKTCTRSKIVLTTKMKKKKKKINQFGDNSPRIFLVMMCATFLMCFARGRNGISKKMKQN